MTIQDDGSRALLRDCIEYLEDREGRARRNGIESLALIASLFPRGVHGGDRARAARWLRAELADPLAPTDSLAIRATRLRLRAQTVAPGAFDVGDLGGIVNDNAIPFIAREPLADLAEIVRRPKDTPLSKLKLWARFLWVLERFVEFRGQREKDSAASAVLPALISGVAQDALPVLVVNRIADATAELGDLGEEALTRRLPVVARRMTSLAFGLSEDGEATRKAIEDVERTQPFATDHPSDATGRRLLSSIFGRPGVVRHRRPWIERAAEWRPPAVNG